MKKRVIVQLVDSLSLGGIERMSVNISNVFTLYNIKSHLIVTRIGGGLLKFVSKDVHLKIFNKSSFFDVFTFIKILVYLKNVKPDVLHAHQTSIFWSVLFKAFLPNTKVVWHDHFGQSEMLDLYPRKEMNWIMPFIDSLVTVNDTIKKYWEGRFPDKKNSIFYLANFPEFLEISRAFPTSEILSIINVANFRKQKDQLTLLEALSIIKQKDYFFKASLIGEFVEENWLELVKNRILELDLEKDVEIVGPVTEISPYLESAHIGVLSSESEGLPVALLEYGMAGLPTVATQVGQCDQVLGYGQFGWLVPPKSPALLAAALEEVFLDLNKGNLIGMKFKNHIKSNFGPSKFMEGYIQILNKLEKVPGSKV